MQTLVNNRKMHIWVSGQAELSIALKSNQRTLFYSLNKLLRKYPKDTRFSAGDEPCFRAPKSDIRELMRITKVRIDFPTGSQPLKPFRKA